MKQTDGAMSLAQWLEAIQRLHPVEIDMGLERVREVARRLQLGRPAATVITVTGTNGKGSHVATLDTLLRTAGYRVGAYTSPHLLRYNERVQIQGQPVDDNALVDAFEQIEQARGDISLSYFEFGTLAALLIFQRADLDVAVLEVGLGGRLDAVNIIDADVAVVSSIGLDHQEYLGNSRESVAREKAGIFRPGKPVVCTETNPPANLLALADEQGCPVWLMGRDFTVSDTDADTDASWQWRGSADTARTPLRVSALPYPALNIANVAGALQAALLTGLLAKFQPDALQHLLQQALPDLTLAGRQQFVTRQGRHCLLDVSHNPQAAEWLGATLQRWRQQAGGQARVHAVLAMMRDKDHQGFLAPLEKQVDFWYIAQVDLPRCMPAAELAGLLPDNTAPRQIFSRVDQAVQAAVSHSSTADLIVICGSFFTVADALGTQPH